MAGQKDSDFLDDLKDLLVIAPWWSGPPIALGAFLAISVGVPTLIGSTSTNEAVTSSMLRVSGPLISVFAFFVPFLVLMAWGFALFEKRTRRRRLEAQTGLSTINALSWQAFEALLAEAFRRRDYRVAALGGTQPDGGVDLRLSRDGETTLVQCKHWKMRRVGVKVVRELMGVVAGQGADRGIVVTSGDYTEEARAFAASVPVTLMDGPELWRMIQNAQGPRAVSAPMPAAAPISTDGPSVLSASPACPVCGREMVRRVARKGAYAGNEFWGCPAYPKCRGIVNG
jgi:restriction system protein